MTQLPNPQDHPALFEGVLTRRVFAYFIDCIIILLLTSGLFLVTLLFGIVTLGLALITLPLIFPGAVLIYYAVTLGSSNRSTIGMRMMDVVVTPTRNPPLDGWKALLHPFVFWVTIWIFWPLLFVGLFTQRRQLLHDIITRTLVVRRSPMQQHWSNVGDYAI